MSRRYSSSRKPAQALADRITTKCQANNRLWDLEIQIKRQECLVRDAQIAILKYQKEIRLIKEKMDTLPKTRRGLKNAKPVENAPLAADMMDELPKNLTFESDSIPDEKTPTPSF